MPNTSPQVSDFSQSFLIKIALLVTLSNFVMGIFYLGYEIGTCNTTEKHLAHYQGWIHYKTIFVTISSTLMCLGAAFGALLTGKLTNYYGRRKAIIINNAFMLIFVCVVKDI